MYIYNNITSKERKRNKNTYLENNSKLDKKINRINNCLEIRLKTNKINFQKPEEAQAEKSNKSQNRNSQKRNTNTRKHNYLETKQKVISFHKNPFTKCPEKEGKFL